MEKLIVEFLRLSGHAAQKVSTTGVYRDNRKVVTDAVGFQRTIGSGQWTRGTATKGAADIECVLSPSGISVSIEVKFSKGDKLSEEQKRFKEMKEGAGGFFIVAKTLDGFLNDFEELLQHPKIKMLEMFEQSNK